MSPAVVVPLIRSVNDMTGAQIHVSAGGNMAFVSLATTDQAAIFDEQLRRQQLPGITLRGDGPLWCGRIDRPKIASAIKIALDATNRFPELDD
jgi:hypothetical protein